MDPRIGGLAACPISVLRTYPQLNLWALDKLVAGQDVMIRGGVCFDFLFGTCKWMPMEVLTRTFGKEKVMTRPPSNVDELSRQTPN